MHRNSLRFTSLVICVYNEERTIGNKIENMLTNDRNNYVKDVIIVDDSSSDRTFEIISNYAQRDKRLKVIKNMLKKGKWGALVTGYRQAQGEIVCITDADVIFEKDTLEKALRVFDNPLVGVVVGNQKDVLVKRDKEGLASVSLYERCMNFFRIVTSEVDSNVSSHGQCLFVRKAYLDLPEQGLMADDIYLSLLMRRNGYRVLFCRDSYYIEKTRGPFDKNSRRIFCRRARAIAEAMIKNKDILFNPRYKKFGFICFPIWFFLYIVFPFLVIAGLCAAALWLLYYNLISLLLIFASVCIFAYKLLAMVWFQAVSIISYVIQPDANKPRWSISRN